jgi:hypothetical protein
VTHFYEIIAVKKIDVEGRSIYSREWRLHGMKTVSVHSSDGRQMTEEIVKNVQKLKKTCPSVIHRMYVSCEEL